MQYLIHHGVKGQKWGRRRWQNNDGSLTSEGYSHYGVYKANKKRLKQDKKNLKKARVLMEASDKAKRFAKYAAENEQRFQNSQYSSKKKKRLIKIKKNMIGISKTTQELVVNKSNDTSV